MDADGIITPVDVPASPEDLAEAARAAAAEHLAVARSDVSLVLLDARRSVRPVFRASAAGRDLIVKQYLDGDFLDGAAVRLTAAAALRGTVEVPDLLGVDRSRRLMLMSVVRGTPLLALLADATVDAGAVMDRAGAATAALHRSGIDLPARMSRREMFDSSARMVAKYAHATAEYAASTGDPSGLRTVEADAGRTSAGLALAERLIAGAPDDPCVPTHGDFGPGQLFVDDGRIAILDFDRAVMAEAARDLGYFIAHLVRDLPGAHDELAARFLTAYGAATDLPDRAVIDAYTIVVLLRKLARATRPPSMLPSWAAAQADARSVAAASLRRAIDRLIPGDGGA